MPNGDTRPQYGLPYEQLPAATRRDLTPESFVSEQIQTGRQQIQDKYALQWKTVVQSKRFIGAGKAKRMLREIDAKAKQEMLQFDQQAQQQMNQLQNINRLAEQGFIYNADELKARIVYGSDVARSMYPPSKLPEQEFNELQIPLNKIEARLADFGREKKRIKKWFLGEKKEPLVTGELEYLDRSQLYTDDKGVVRQGIWVKAPPEKIAEHRMLLQEKQRIKRLQANIFGRPGIQRRVVQPGTKGGTFDDKIAESVRPRTKRHDPLGLFD
ncbi:hypothetical protein KAR91_78850 [Candidatus Pacearchaeota archaeon]|nr:hypothetical protein [Candidatus Pacearchaeota archaeon]